MLGQETQNYLVTGMTAKIQKIIWLCELTFIIEFIAIAIITLVSGGNFCLN